MKKFIQTIKNIFSIEELRRRILTTLILLLVFRLGSYVVLPGINPTLLKESYGDIRDFLNIFLGGAFSRVSVFALGIMPYISASIVVQLMSVALPSFQKMQREGESGRKKINQITRLLTIGITMVQAYAYISTPEVAAAVVISPAFFTISSLFIITAGTIFCMWLGERITEKGIGNGISMLIMIGIVSRFPQAIVEEFSSRFAKTSTGGPFWILIEFAVLFVVVMAVILFTQAVRRIPIQYAKQVIGNKVYGGQRQYLPLKLNSAGVMPIIFAQSLMFLPSMLINLFARENSNLQATVGVLSNQFSWQYNLTFGILILVFTYFYTAIAIDPRRIAEDMKRSGGFIPGVQPGEATSEYIDDILSKITFPGAIFLALVAVVPSFVRMAGVQQGFAMFFGGTSLLIMIGVVLDTLQQIESYLLMKHYEGLMKSGKVSDTAEETAVA
jgi:preprotein translocase subunit SecY